MKILVTGGAGFIGSHLVECLLRRGDEVTCIDNFDTFYDPAIKEYNIAGVKDNKNFTLYKTDIRDLGALKTIFGKHEPAVVVHLAARAGVRPSIIDPLLYQDVNVRGTMNVLECARIYNAKKIVFGSSSSIYGSRREIPFREDDNAQKPISPYAATKMAGEMLCYTYHHICHIPVTCLRFFTAYGPRQRPEMAIHKFTRDIVNGKEVHIFGDGNTARDYTYVSDIVDGIKSAVDKDFDYEIINLGDSNAVKLNYLIKLIEDNTGKQAKIKRMNEQIGDVPITCASIDKARKLLAYSPKVKIEIGVKKFVEWYMAKANMLHAVGRKPQA